jgi:hypothetical protein
MFVIVGDAQLKATSYALQFLGRMIEFHDCFKAFMILLVQPSACSHADEQEQVDETSPKGIAKHLQAIGEQGLLRIVDGMPASLFLWLMN